MTRIAIVALSVGLFACGGDDGGEPPPDVPEMITISGTAVLIDTGGSMPEEGVLVEAFENSDDASAVANATTDAQGNYTMVIATNGQPLDGFLKATKGELVVTYLYPPEELIADFDGASLNMIASDTLGLLGAVCQGNQDPTMGLIAMLAQDGTGVEIAGASFTSTPAPTKVCYNGASGLPDSQATATEADGIGYLFNVTGSVTVSASADGKTFPSHQVTARPAALTTTLILSQ